MSTDRPDSTAVDPRLQIIVAMDPDRVIGRDNQLPWHLPEDLKHFKRITSGHTLVMGRRTHESIGRPLPNRRNIVLTRQAHWRAPGVEVHPDLESALAVAGDVPVFVIGGAELFREALPRAAVIHLTKVHRRFPGDVFFPPADDGWSVAWEEEHGPDANHESGFTFQRLERAG
ncbi:dihydrofolate reductase [Thioalkalivibrio sp.]|uniref:dihydrofolate reductase n=1 Tax=Thioalkalivibrio sp. TaxID=2093813 RepID=UPI0012D7023E|nr:dihydrofolate reductase [Thioalkalivibrio sp.]TVP82941.1 MAG: dihydrofolate reductase [Thioalkalivibrio sp.]